MIVNERYIDFLEAFRMGDSDILEQIGEAARRDGVPIVKSATGDLLRVLIRTVRPDRVLEIGTAVGYSAILMRECMKPESSIVTIENYEKRIPIARENIKRAGYEDSIFLIEGDAMEVMPGLEPGFDFVFMDAAKAQYIRFLPQVMRLLRKGGMLVTDNVLQDGDVIESRFAIRRRDRTIHSRMRDYLWQINHMPELETSMLTVGDGVTISVKLTD